MQYTRNQARANSEALEMARSFLHCITKASPVSKGRLKYMQDFGFVMLVFACCFILRFAAETLTESCGGTREGGDREPLTKEAVIQDVRDVADLLTSLSSKQDSVAAAYGRALHEACKSLEPSASPPSMASRTQSRNGIASTPFRETVRSTGSDATQHGGSDEAGAPTLAGEDAEGMVYGSLGRGQEPFQGFYRQINVGEGMSDARAEGGCVAPWYGTYVDGPSGLLLDALSVPWQYG